MTRSTAIRRIACTMCAAILAVAFSVSAFADDTAASDYYETVYEPSMYFWNLAVSSEDYGGYLNGIPFTGASGTAPKLTGSFTVPLDLDSRFTHLYFGASYSSVTGTYDVGATFKMVVSVTTGVSGSYNTSVRPYFFKSLASGKYISKVDRVSLPSSYSVSVGDSDTYNFTFDNISYDNIAGSSFFYVDFALSAFSSSLDDELYIVNSYFGLSSYYDENKYNSQTLENLTEISGKLDNIEDAINDAGDGIQSGLADVGNKVDDAADQISGDLDELQEEIATQHIKEEEYAGDKGNDASDQANDALTNSGISPDVGNIWSGLKTLYNSISTTETVSFIPVPEVKLPSLTVAGVSTSETVLIEEQQYDISQFLQNESIQKLISGAKVLYYIFFCIFLVDYCRKLLAKIGLGDVNTNDNTPAKTDTARKDPAASTSDPHGLKSR